jgi:hypothetical protein
MELQEFIQQTLVQIAKGISEANLKLADIGATANPKNFSILPTAVHSHGYCTPESKGYKYAQLIEFDVAVYALEGKEKSGGIGIAVASIGLGGKAKSESSTSSESHIKFSIPMLFPEGK